MAKGKDERSRDKDSDAFSHAFIDLPDDPSRRLDALLDVSKHFRHAFAAQLQPVIRSLVQEHTPADDPGRRELVHRVNVVLHDAGLAVADPESHQRGTLVTDEWKIKLRSRAGDGSRVRTHNIKALPPLELIEHVRQEPFMTWQKRIDRDNPPGGRDKK